MEVKFAWSNTIKLCHSSLAEAPERFYSVYMIFSSCKLILTVKYSVVVISIENEWIISFPSIGINNRSFEYFPLYYRHEFSSRAVLYNTHKNSSISLEKSKYRSFSCGSPSPLSSNSSRTKVTFIQLKFSSVFISLFKAFWFFNRESHNSFSKSIVPKIHCIAIYTHNLCCLSSCKIFKKIVKNYSNLVCTQFTVFDHMQAL